KLREICPKCGRPVTVGVLNRVEELADREEGCAPPATGGRVLSLIPLVEIVAEILDAGAATKGVTAAYEALLAKLGPELRLLSEVALEEIGAKGNSIFAEAISRLRQGRVIREAGFDGEYGVIRLFDEALLSGREKKILL
ncbi:MAG: AAA family ATPase, partial [bacterium]